jgi:hypothetical protein
MNLRGLLLPDFSARVCGAQLARACSAVRAGLRFLAGLRVLRCTLLPPPLWNTPSFIIDRSQESSGGRGPPRALAPRSRRWPPNLSRAPGLSEEPVASLRRFPLSFLGDRWRGDIDLDQLRVVGDAADERSPCEIRRGPHWKKSGQCQASHNCSGGSKEEPDFS